MHYERGIQSLGWMRVGTNNQIQTLQCRQGLVIYFDVSNREPAFLNSFLLSCSDESGTVANMCTQFSSAFSSEVSYENESA